MGAIAGLDDLLNRVTGGGTGNPQNLFYYKNGQILGADPVSVLLNQATFRDLWMYEGVRAGPSATPGAVSIPDNTTQGGLLQSNPGGGRQLWMVSHTGWQGNSGFLVIYDRLLHVSGFSGTSTASQTVGGSITRYTDGAGNIAFAEVYTLIGSTAVTLTGTYTDQDGNSSTFPTSTAHTIGASGGNNTTGFIAMLPLASGDTGVRGVTNVQLSATTGTAGDWGLTIAHPLAIIPCVANCGGFFIDYVDWIPEILPGACLGMLMCSNTGTVAQGFGNLVLVEA